MPTHNTYIYILIMALVTYLVRVLPLTLIRKEIKNITGVIESGRLIGYDIEVLVAKQK